MKKSTHVISRSTSAVKSPNRHNGLGKPVIPAAGFLFKASPAIIPLVLAISAAYSDQPQAAEARSSYIEEVIITARRREESMQEVPITVSVMDGDALREKNIGELNDLAVAVPGLTVSTAGPSTNVPIVVLRGQRPSEVTMTVDPAVPIYFADLALTPTQGTNLGMYDLSNIQVLKGPQGTLFGRNSTGGAMLMTPQRPGDEFGGYTEVKLGNYDLRHIEGAVDIPASDTLKMRVAGRSVDRDGYQSNVANNALRSKNSMWDEDSYGVRWVIDFTPTEKLSTLTTLAYDKNDMNARVPTPNTFNSEAGLGPLMSLIHDGALGRAFGGLFGLPTDAGITDAFARQHDRNWKDVEVDLLGKESIENQIAANTIEYEISDDLTLKNILGYRKLDYQYSADSDGIPLPIWGQRFSTGANGISTATPGTISTEQFSNELQLIGTAFGERLDWIVGAYWFEMEGKQTSPLTYVGRNPDWPDLSYLPSFGPQVDQLFGLGALGMYADSPRGKVKNNATALFGEGTYHFDDQWSMTVGLRKSWDERAMWAESQLQSVPGVVGCGVLDENNAPLSNDNCSRKVTETFSKPTWRAAVNYNISDSNMVYTSVSTGYRTGGFNGRGTSNLSLVPFKEETVTNYEIGQKADWELSDDISLRTNVAVYLQDYQDIQKTVSALNPQTGGFETYTVNAAKAEIQGIDMDMLIALGNSWQINLSYAYVDASYKEWDREYPNGSGNIVDFSKAPFVYIAENSVTASVRYALPVDASYGDIAIMASAYWQDETIANDAAWMWPQLGWSADNLNNSVRSTQIDGFTVWNMRLDWQQVMGSNVDLAAFINNVADEDYITGGLNVPDSLGWASDNYGPPRTFGASVRYHF